MKSAVPKSVVFGFNLRMTSQDKISGAALRELKAKAQLLDPIFRVGKAGVTPEFLQLLDDALKRRKLVKIKFEGENKEKKKELAPEIAEKTSSFLVMLVGNVATYYRAGAAPAPDPVKP